MNLADPETSGELAASSASLLTSLAGIRRPSARVAAETRSSILVVRVEAQEDPVFNLQGDIARRRRRVKVLMHVSLAVASQRGVIETPLMQNSLTSAQVSI